MTSVGNEIQFNSLPDFPSTTSPPCSDPESDATLTEGSHNSVATLKQDHKYWERRRKNNLAAKKSRDARRIRENQLRVKVMCLENANQVYLVSLVQYY